MPTLSSILSCSLTALALSCAGSLFAENTHNPEPVVLSNPDISYGDPGTFSPIPGLRKGQQDGPKDTKPLKQLNNSGKGKPGGGGGSVSDPVAQQGAATSLAHIIPALNIEGLGNGFAGFQVDSAPPDTNGVAGSKQYVQWVNESYAVFSKNDTLPDGTLLEGPTPGNAPFQSLGATHPCAVNNDGDPIVQYDKFNHRWILTQFSITNGGTAGYWQCIAVSKGDDATLKGGYYAYAFREPYFNDYPKFGVWNGTYYATYNMFNGNTFAGGRFCAYNGAAMRSGSAAAEQCFQLSTAYGGILPADVDGPTQPATDEYFIGFGTNSLLTWRFHADFANSANTKLVGPYTTSVAAFSEACNGGTCVPQPGTTQQLDSLGDRLMYRLSYRKFSDHEALFVTHSVNPGYVAAGARWYELRPASGGTTGVTVAQQSTYAPNDGRSRWMGSIASDKMGNVAMGYSVSGTSEYPSIYYSVRSPSDASNQLGAEHILYTGTGSQQHTLSRWGDYSTLSVDPADDCTFWFTSEYLLGNGIFNWHTRIGSFKIEGCQ